jgi:hypothetical protein
MRNTFYQPLSIALILIGLSSVKASIHKQEEIGSFLENYCLKCHGGEKVKGKINFVELLAENREITKDFKVWEKVLNVLEHREMPPEEEIQPADSDFERFQVWYRRKFVETIEAKPDVFKPRRLSAIEYRNTLESLLGFELKVAIMKAEQTVAETSLAMKLLPIDPPGETGFTNDTSGNPLTTLIWEQYDYLVDAGLSELFSPKRRSALERYTGTLDESGTPTSDQATAMLKKFFKLAWRRPIPEERLQKSIDAIEGKKNVDCENALKTELKAILMSPAFIYRGLLAEGNPGKVQAIDPYELAERLSFFLWADMPDEKLLNLAELGTLKNPEILHEEVVRLLDSPKSRSLSEVFASQWLALDQIAENNKNPPQALALKTQPLDFMDYLFREDRPLTELVDSNVAFMNPHTAGYYPGDNQQFPKYRKQKGIEVEAVDNHKILLKQVKERGGVLTIPGVLQMNPTPITRGTWILERILGDHLGEPPPNVGQIPPSPRGKKLTFRQRFEMHRTKAACAVCHNKIDPLGFALQAYHNTGAFKKQTPTSDTQGKLPTGETFENFEELKKILVTSRKRDLIRNIVERTITYALCRKMEIHDQPTLDQITDKLSEQNGTYRMLVREVVNSLPFQQAYFPE